MPDIQVGTCLFILMINMPVQAQNEYGLQIFIITVATGAWAGFLITRRNRQILQQLQRYRHLPAKFEEVHSTINKLLKQEEIKERLIVLYNRNDHFSPNIFKHDDIVYLVLPRRLVVLARTDKPAFRAIIAHELAHIVQGDTNLWWNYELATNTYRISAAACLFIAVAFGYPAGVPRAILYFVSAYCLHLALRAPKNYQVQRYASELHADIFSICATGSVAILNILDRGYISDTATMHHPGASNRKERVQHVLTQIGVTLESGAPHESAPKPTEA